MKFLVTNDDGIDAPGLEALVSAARTIGDPIVVAPASPQSGVSHAVTWREGVRIEPRGENGPSGQTLAVSAIGQIRRGGESSDRQSGGTLAVASSDRFAVYGTPADCTRLGLLRLVPDAKWVLSGINHGANLGADMYYSGTVAAVREAVLHGWPGVAVSHYRKSGVDYDWPRAVKWVTPILTEILAKPIEAGLFYNVNLPILPAEADDPEVVWCSLDPNPLPLNYRHEEESGLYYAGDYQLRHRTPGADVDVCFGGRIAVTAVGLL